MSGNTPSHSLSRVWMDGCRICRLAPVRVFSYVVRGMMKSNTSEWTDDTVPYICWDRHWTVADIRRRLATSEEVERHRLMAWLMRELKTSEVWFFLKPAEIQREFDGISRWLGPARPLWTYLLGTWHALGRI